MNEYGPSPDCPTLIQLGRWAAEVHDSVANLLVHNKGSCGDDCKEANEDNLKKLKEYRNLLPEWLAEIETWGTNGTMANVTGNAVFWADQAVKAGWQGFHEGPWHHLENQVGILRAVTNSYISNHGCHPTDS